MNKMTIMILILAILTTMTLTEYALAAESSANISTNETVAVSTPVGTNVINDKAKIINITEDSNETTVVETIIEEEQKKSSSGFSLIDTVISLITVIILIMAMLYIKKK
jgi:hypothetical protein